jgi:hypothetical protein
LFTFRVRFEGSELVHPESLHVINPVFDGPEWFGPKPINSKARVKLDALGLNDFDEAGPSKDAEVAAEGRPADRAAGCDFTGAELVTAEDLDDAKPGGVGEGDKGFR